MAKLETEQLITSYGNVLLIDPNRVNVDANQVNAIPQYQDMFIFAELTAKRRPRSVIERNANGTTSLTDDEFNNAVTVNFIGNNQDGTKASDGSYNNPNYLNFTTNWYDGSSPEGKQFEGFGITGIKVLINSSFVPQVNIDFVDIRGVAFFNQKNSPYKILFDFPPPIFDLTLKGYYGMALNYKLHLVKYTSEFKAENGNFVINAQFVALTFAPLADVLFRYAINFPLIPNDNNVIDSSDVKITPNTEIAPTSTFQLYLKLKNLYSAYNKFQQTDPEVKAYNNSLTDLAKVDEAITSLSEFNYDEILHKEGTTLTLLVNNIEYQTGGEYSVLQLTPIDKLSDYNTYIINNGGNTNTAFRLMITYTVSNQIPSTAEVNTTIINKYYEALNNYKKKLDDTSTNLNLGSRIPVVNNNSLFQSSQDIINKYIKSNTTNSTSAPPDLTNQYVGLDITDYYIKLYNKRADLFSKKTSAINDVNTKINNMIHDNLGMNPTIYNIFKVILDDVDIFFRKMYETARRAEDSHNQPNNFSKIVNDQRYGDIKSKIFAFPLVIENEPYSGGIKQVRRAPVDFDINLFPELILVNNFIETFTRQTQMEFQYNMRNIVNADTSNIWIPISPPDSTLVTNDIKTPYVDIDSPDGGSSKYPISTSENSKPTDILNILLTRFYVLSQNALSNIFYDKKASTNLIDLYSQSESINLAISIFNPTLIDNLITIANNYSANVEGFYSEIQKNNNVLYSLYDPTISGDDKNITKFNIDSNGQALYLDRGNPSYVGLFINPQPIITQSVGTDVKPVDNYLKVSNVSWWKTIFAYSKLTNLKYFKFSQQNVVYLQDSDPTGGDANNVQSRFIANLKNIQTENGNNISFNNSNDYVFKSNILNDIVNNNEGNGAFYTMPISTTVTKSMNNIVDVWVDQLSRFDNIIKQTIVGSNKKLSQILLLSNFGYSLSAFNVFPDNLNKTAFSLPAAIQTPKFMPSYMGSLVGISVDDSMYNALYDYFVNGIGKDLSSSGILIFADIIDINQYLSDNDKQSLQTEYKTYDSDEYNDMVNSLKQLIDEVNNGTNYSIDQKIKKYKELLSPNGKYFSILSQYMLQKTNIMNFNGITFSRTNISDDKVSYESISAVNSATGNQDKKTINDNFFRKLFQNLQTDLKAQKKKVDDTKNENRKLTGDNDIITETYYSLKNINDKWLVDPKNANFRYPFIGNDSKNLIDSFVFVDRAMNPIGETIINPETIIDAFDTPDISIYTLITQLLTKNGFEFFPLQNFMKFSKPDEWKQSFAIDAEINSVQSPTFVCMYIGGASSYPSGINSGGQFVDDGIIDFSKNDINDFTNNADNYKNQIENAAQTTNNVKFPWKEVRAFRVKFGEQNQSMFTGIKIDSKEYPETNESIQIMARLAGDNKLNAPPVKGQNLYSIYENRAYRATVTGLGNMMIQPTQYFQLENVPLFNGAYLILSVEHTVEPNKMVTNFTGTKILKFPIPRVLQPSAILGFPGGNAYDTNPSTTSSEGVTEGVNAGSNPTLTQYNSMYTFKIQ